MYPIGSVDGETSDPLYNSISAADVIRAVEPKGGRVFDGTMVQALMFKIGGRYYNVELNDDYELEYVKQRYLAALDSTVREVIIVV